MVVAANPSLDRFLWVDRLRPGALHRVRRVESLPSGKGVNVGRILAGWGHGVVVTGFVAGQVGRDLEEDARRAGMEPRFLHLAGGETRINTKVLDEEGRLTELNEPGPPLTPSDAGRLLEQVVDLARPSAGAPGWLVLSGSLPPGAPPALYHDMTGAVRTVNPAVRVAVDTSGEPLRHAVAARPDLVKLNRAEFQELGTARSPAALATLTRGRVVVTLGPEGAVFHRAGDPAPLWVKADPVRVVNPNGCGDVLLAALLHGSTRGWDWEATARFAVAAATLTALHATLPRLAEDEVVRYGQRLAVSRTGPE